VLEAAKSRLRELAETSRDTFLEIGQQLSDWRDTPEIGAMGVRQLIAYMSRISPYSPCQLRIAYRIARGTGNGGLPVEILETVLYSEQPSKVDIMSTEVAVEMVGGKEYTIIDSTTRRLVKKPIFDFTKAECTDFVRSTGVLATNDQTDGSTRRYMRPNEIYWCEEKKAYIAVVDARHIGVLIDPKMLEGLRVNEVA